MKLLKVSGHVVAFLLLTAITQIGGLIWLVTVLTIKFLKPRRKSFAFITAFFTIYFLSTFLLIPPLARKMGREPLPYRNHPYIKPHHLIYVLLNRHYVVLALKDVLEKTAKEINEQYSGTRLVYLDANFPFLNGFPLLPHLSHNDGRKVDLAFLYKDGGGKRTNEKPSVSGYGVFEGPDSGETNTTVTCKEKGYWQYDYPNYLTFGKRDGLFFDPEGTKKLATVLARHARIEKIFIEPHLKQRLGLHKISKIRFHGCQAVRHDDHIHIQMK